MLAIGAVPWLAVLIVLTMLVAIGVVVTHWIYFEDPAERSVAAERLAAAGYQIQQTAADPDIVEQTAGLRIERVDRVDLTSIDAAVLEILDLVDGLDAEV